MASFTDYITVEGERMLAKAVAGTSVSFTKIVIGSGYMPSGAYEKNIKEVITPEVELPVQSVSVNSSDSVLITSRFTNKDIEHGFFLREKAVYMSDGNDEVLAIYGNNGSSAEFIDTAEVCVVDKTIKSVVKLSTQELANINIVDDTYEFAPLIEPDIKAINDFVKTTAALAMRVGQRVILNKWTAYTYIGYDPTDASCYITGANVLSDVYDEKLADGSAERGVGASQNALFNVYGIARETAKGLSFHLQDKENPHEVTKEQVGLGKVPNVETNDQTPTYEESEELKTLKSGEKLSVSFGKIMKAITELIGLTKNVSELNKNLIQTNKDISNIKTHNSYFDGRQKTINSSYENIVISTITIDKPGLYYICGLCRDLTIKDNHYFDASLWKDDEWLYSNGDKPSGVFELAYMMPYITYIDKPTTFSIQARINYVPSGGVIVSGYVSAVKINN